jgi:hypothetical protein
MDSLRRAAWEFTQFILCELLRVTVRVILGAMQGYVRRLDRRSVSVDFPRLSHRINVLIRILSPCIA